MPPLEPPGDAAANALHTPVLADRAVEIFTPALTGASTSGEGAVLVDGTLGLGGHTELFLTTFPDVKVIGLDRDDDALRKARRRLAVFSDRIDFVHTRFDGIAEAIQRSRFAPNNTVNAVLFDLGVSSMQLDQADRGFAYSVDAPLDMRMDQSQPLTAADIVNTYSHSQLTRILRTYGEERFAGKIASAIVRQRDTQLFSRSEELVELLYRTIPAASRRTGGHPAKRTFQALRIEVNAELEALESAASNSLDRLAAKGRIIFMSYQSLEDRIVKRVLAERATSKTPPGLPVELPGMGPELMLLTRGAEKATDAEIIRNQRAAPVRMRAAEKLAN